LMNRRYPQTQQFPIAGKDSDPKDDDILAYLRDE